MEKNDEELRVEANRESMGRIWIAIPKEPGMPTEMVRYTHNDLRYLYDFGFADVRAYSYEQWEGAFQEFKQPDGSYLFNKDQFINKIGRYKYAGQVKHPLDPMKVREGWYDIEQWRTFLVRNVLPSTTALTPEFMVEGEKKANEQGLIKNGRIKIGKEVKLWLKQILDNYPSPMRRREISMQKHYDEMVRKAAASGGKSIGQLQKSTFDTGKKVGDAKRKDLDEVLVKRSKVSAQASDKETFSMKDLRKKGVSKSRKSTV